MSIKKFAYVMLCMKGDLYAPGVIVMAESIRMTGSTHDIVCMCTPDVSEQVRKDIATVAQVEIIDYVRYATKHMKTKRQMDLYGSWLAEGYTKWRCLELNYDKVLFVDADMVVANNIDHLFDLPAPAGTFSTPWAKEYSQESSFDLRGYPQSHADVVAHQAISDTFERGNGYTMIASMVLLEPSKTDFQELCAMINRLQPFGLDNWSTPDEQSIVYYYAVEKQRDWVHIHQKYNFIVHKINWITTGNTIVVPQVLHYFSSTKPWLMKNSFTKSPFPTDLVWWWLLRHWWKRTGNVLKLHRFSEMMDSEKITIKNSKMIQELFPWIAALRVPYPDLFQN